MKVSKRNRLCSMNMTVAPFSDNNVCLALKHAIDLDGLCLSERWWFA